MGFSRQEVLERGAQKILRNQVMCPGDLPLQPLAAETKLLGIDIMAELISSPVSVSRGALLVTKELWGRMVTDGSDRCCQMPPGQGWVLQSRQEKPPILDPC